MSMLRSTKAGNTMPVIFEFGRVSVMVLGVSVNGLNALMVLSVLLGLKTLNVLKVLMMRDERLELEGNPGSVDHRKCGTPKQRSSTV